MKSSQVNTVEELPPRAVLISRVYATFHRRRQEVAVAGRRCRRMSRTRNQTGRQLVWVAVSQTSRVVGAAGASSGHWRRYADVISTSRCRTVRYSTSQPSSAWAASLVSPSHLARMRPSDAAAAARRCLELTQNTLGHKSPAHRARWRVSTRLSVLPLSLVASRECDVIHSLTDWRSLVIRLAGKTDFAHAIAGHFYPVTFMNSRRLLKYAKLKRKYNAVGRHFWRWKHKIASDGNSVSCTATSVIFRTLLRLL